MTEENIFGFFGGHQEDDNLAELAQVFWGEPVTLSFKAFISSMSASSFSPSFYPYFPFISQFLLTFFRFSVRADFASTQTSAFHLQLHVKEDLFQIGLCREEGTAWQFSPSPMTDHLASLTRPVAHFLLSSLVQPNVGPEIVCQRLGAVLDPFHFAQPEDHRAAIGKKKEISLLPASNFLPLSKRNQDLLERGLHLLGECVVLTDPAVPGLHKVAHNAAHNIRQSLVDLRGARQTFVGNRSDAGGRVLAIDLFHVLLQPAQAVARWAGLRETGHCSEYSARISFIQRVGLGNTFTNFCFLQIIR